MKKLLNEILPDPKQAERDLQKGSPRARTAEHLKRIVAAAAALQLGTAVADNSVPGDKGKNGNKPPDAQKPPERPPEPPGYGVVDPMPPPYINRNEGEGYLTIESKPPGAQVMIDGASVGLTPVGKFTVTPGMHAITATAPGMVTKNLTVKVKKGKTEKVVLSLQPEKPKK
jgi:hypothetical protein